MSSLTLLGPQRPRANAAAALDAVRGDGPIVAIAAGWRHDETDEPQHGRTVGPDARTLPLYGWFEIVMKELPELRAAYRARQDRLIRLSAMYRVRLEHGIRALRALRAEGHDAVGRAAWRAALDDVRRIDEQLIASMAALRAGRSSTRPWEDHPLVASLRDKAVATLAEAGVVVLTGGHVAVLRNRLAFFGVDAELRAAAARGTPMVAWSAGAMVLTERVVLFHDDPPDGPAVPEVFDLGVGLARDLVVFPHARQRLQLDLAPRVAELSGRFAPARCLALQNGGWVTHAGGEWVNRGDPAAALVMQADGSLVPLPEAP